MEYLPYNGDKDKKFIPLTPESVTFVERRIVRKRLGPSPFRTELPVMVGGVTREPGEGHLFSKVRGRRAHPTGSREGGVV